MANNIKCTCGHSWSESSSSKKDMHVCHICGKDNTMEDGGWLSKYEQGGMVLKQQANDNYGKKANPNDVQATVGPGFVGLGYNIKGRNYSPAWGGQFQDGGFLQPISYKLPSRYRIPYAEPSTELATSIGGGPGEPAYLIPTFKYGKPLQDPEAEYRKTGEHLGGPFKTYQEAEKWEQEIRHPYVEKGKPIPTPLKRWGDMAMGGGIPGAVGFTYARVAGSAPANGKYTKKTKASAQNGQEMKFYQEGLDFKPKTISQNGSVIKDDRGQWAYPGEITEINSNDITMQGVDYPVLGISDTGDTQMMYPDQDYKFDGNKVTEYPIMKNGGWLDKYQGGGQLKKPTLKEISQIPEKRYEPSDAVKNIKATLSAADLATIPFAGNPIGFAVNRGIGALNSIADATTSLRYAIDGQWKNAGIDFGEAVLDLVPFKKGRLSKLDKSSNKALKIGKGVSYADDFQDVVPEKENGGWLTKYK